MNSSCDDKDEKLEFIKATKIIRSFVDKYNIKEDDIKSLRVIHDFSIVVEPIMKKFVDKYPMEEHEVTLLLLASSKIFSHHDKYCEDCDDHNQNTQKPSDLH
jgi:hypothetical protein